jgi:hypothetical protein
MSYNLKPTKSLKCIELRTPIGYTIKASDVQQELERITVLPIMLGSM